jgi:hypothetical protein
LVVVTPGGILAALMLYFSPQYKQVIFFVAVVCWTFFAGSGFAVAAASNFSEIPWPQDLHLVLVTPCGMDFGLI